MTYANNIVDCQPNVNSLVRIAGLFSVIFSYWRDYVHFRDDMEVVKQGAEAKLYKSKLFGRSVIVKQRFKKLYRHAQLDYKLSRKRTVQEARTMLKCRRAGIKTPLPYYINLNTNEIYMEFIEESKTFREVIDNFLKDKDPAVNSSELTSLGLKLGSVITLMHSIDIVHGDLTTSNILVTKDNDLVLIDFGLSSSSSLIEDLGVDLYVLERAFLGTHPDAKWLFDVILKCYFENPSDHQKALNVKEKLDEIRLRGRKRVMIG